MTEYSRGSSAARPNLDDSTSAKDQAAEVAQSGKQAATDVAQSGKQAAGEVAQTATTAAKDVAQETKQQANDLLGKTKDQLTEQVTTQQSAVVENLRSLGDQLAAMTDHVDQEGTAVDLAAKARDRAREAADWLDGREPSDVLDELRKVGRERPGPFLLGALVAGVVAGRMTRGVVAVHTDDSSDPAPAVSAPSAPRGLAPATPSSPGRPAARHDLDSVRDTPAFGKPSANSAPASGYTTGGTGS